MKVFQLLFVALAALAVVPTMGHVRGQRRAKNDVAVCHKGMTLSVNANALKGFLNQGDTTEGPCDAGCPAELPDLGSDCSFDDECPYGTEECCGQVFDSFVAVCMEGQVQGFNTDACFSGGPCACPAELPPQGECSFEGRCRYGTQECCEGVFDTHFADCMDGQVAVAVIDACIVEKVEAIYPGECDPRCFEVLGCFSCPSGSWNDGCNVCHCDSDGNEICTERACLVQGVPFCVPDCSRSLCLVPECSKGESVIALPGDCCPSCVPDPDCDGDDCDGVSAVPFGKCEQECFDETVDCKSCPNGYNDGCNDCNCDENGREVCTERFCLVQGIPFCLPDCSAIRCRADLECPEGSEATTLPGDCCLSCVEVEDCSSP